MSLNPSNSSNLEQLALKGLTFGTDYTQLGRLSASLLSVTTGIVHCENSNGYIGSVPDHISFCS